MPGQRDLFYWHSRNAVLLNGSWPCCCILTDSGFHPHHPAPLREKLTCWLTTIGDVLPLCMHNVTVLILDYNIINSSSLVLCYSWCLVSRRCPHPQSKTSKWPCQGSASSQLIRAIMAGHALGHSLIMSLWCCRLYQSLVREFRRCRLISCDLIEPSNRETYRKHFNELYNLCRGGYVFCTVYGLFFSENP